MIGRSYMVAVTWLSLACAGCGGSGLAQRSVLEAYRVKSPQVKAINSVGSGDALVAGIVMGLVEKRPFEETLRLAAAAGAANAASPLACRIGPADVTAHVSRAYVSEF